MKILVVIDMQNDFITGSLANPSAAAIVNGIADYIKNFDGPVIFTRDTHQENYLDTYEGKHLNIEHCIQGSNGWYVNDKIYEAANKDSRYEIDKTTFGCAKGLYYLIDHLSINMFHIEHVDQIEFVGTATEICVISNVLGLKPYFPDADFVVHADMCAGLTEEGHKAALEVMKACQVQVIE